MPLAHTSLSASYTLSVVIPAYNEEKYLAGVLTSLRDFPPTHLREIIVVDNGSTDRTVAIAESFPGVRVLSEPMKGVTRARQRGLFSATGTHVAFFDADTRIPSSWSMVLEQALQEDPTIVAISGPYVYDDLSPIRSVFVRLFWILASTVSCWTGYVIVGGNVVARRDVLMKIGGFDTAIAFFGDDTNLARRLAAVGRVRFHRSLFVYSSARRLNGDGFLTTAWTYVLNFLSEVIVKKPYTSSYTDIR